MAEVESKKKKRGRPRQLALPGTENSALKDLEETAHEYADIRDERIDLNQREADLKDKLSKLMKKHGKKDYVHAEVEIHIQPEGETVKVKIHKDKEKSKA